jgi:tetratricopeptide (TPR) repeat protein
MMSAGETANQQSEFRSPTSAVKRAIPLTALIVGGMLSIVVMARWIDAHRPTTPPEMEEESLYLTSNAAKRISLGFNGLAADWYWMRALQYVGKKILGASEEVVIDDLRKLNLKLLAPLLDTTTTLDPQFLEPYQYAAVVLPAIDVQEAIRITNKGIAANPNAWRLYQHLGYIYWRLRDYKSASETYAKAAKIPGAPYWLEAMSAHMASEGGSRAVAREIYGRMYEEAVDAKVKEMARWRLQQLDSLDQRDKLRQVLTAYHTRLGRCPASWKEAEPAFRSLKWKTDATGAPLDAGGMPYVLDKERCDAVLDPKSDPRY